MPLPRKREAGPATGPATKNRLATDKPRVRRAVILVEDHTLIVKGAVIETLHKARFKPIWVGTVGGAMLDRFRDGYDRLPDVEVVLEVAGFQVRLVDGTGDAR